MARCPGWGWGGLNFREERKPSTNSRQVSPSLGACAGVGGDRVGQVGAAWLGLPVLEKVQVLPNKVGRFSQVYPAGPLFLPGAHPLRTVPHLLPKNELKELILRERDIKALPPEEEGLPVHWWPLRREGSKKWVELLLLLFQGTGQSGPNFSKHQLKARVSALQVGFLMAGGGETTSLLNRAQLTPLLPLPHLQQQHRAQCE